MPYLFTSESVSEGHPDKIADQISDAILDKFLHQDPNAKVACETLVTTGLVSINGEVNSTAYIDLQSVAREVIKRIGYTKAEYRFDGDSCAVISTLHEQSPDINQGVVRTNPEDQGAGDQGIMFGYACNETDNYMPLTLELSHLILQELAILRREGKEITYLRPDAKSQVTIEYTDDHHPLRIHTIVVSTQHDDFADDATMHQQITNDIKTILLPRVKSKLPERVQTLFNDDFILHVNPTGKFVIWWPHGDTGLTGRKIIVDTYGGRGAHGGGAFSGKDPSKVDRSAAYAARHIAKNLVAAGITDKILVQLSYAIGVAKPISIYVNTYGTSKVQKSDGEIADILASTFDLRPAKIIERLKLQHPIYEATASYGHFGRTPYEENGIEYFTWEKLEYVEILKEKFGIIM